MPDENGQIAHYVQFTDFLDSLGIKYIWSQFILRVKRPVFMLSTRVIIEAVETKREFESTLLYKRGRNLPGFSNSDQFIFQCTNFTLKL